MSTSVIADRQAEVEAIHSEMFADRIAARKATAARVHTNGNGTAHAMNLTDLQVIEIACNARNGAKFKALYGGDRSGYPSWSDADLALCAQIAFYVGPDPGRIDSIFRGSGLIRSKWDRADYRQRTIAKALEGRTEFYEGRHLSMTGNGSGKPRGWDPAVEPSVDGADDDGSHADRGGSEDADASEEPKRPTVLIKGGDGPHVVDRMQEILAGEHRRTGIYDQNGRLVQVTAYARSEDKRVPLIRRVEGVPILKTLTSIGAYDLATRYIDFRKLDRRARKEVSIDCPPKFADTLIDRGGAAFLPLLGIIHAPLMRADGTILCIPGYDQQTGLLLVADPNWPAIPDNPSSDDIAAAAKVLCEPVEEFPFVSENDRAVALSAIVTGIQRRLLETAPLHAFDAPIQSAGKTLLADLTALIGTGYPPATMTAGYDEHELEKRLITSLLAGDATINIDNLEEPLRSDFLASVLTRASIDTRIMGGNDKAKLSTNMLCMLTGNNLSFSGDMPSRVIAARLDPNREHPEERTFRIPDLRLYVAQHRRELVTAALTILRGHFVAGRPQMGLKPFGRFEQWTDIRAALVWAGFADPCGTRERIVSDDPERDTTVALLSAWHAKLGDQSMTARQVIAVAETDEPLRFALLDVAADQYKAGETNSQRLGKWCQHHVDRVTGGLRLRKVPAAPSSTGRWFIEKPREAVA